LNILSLHKDVCNISETKNINRKNIVARMGSINILIKRVFNFDNLIEYYLKYNSLPAISGIMKNKLL